MPLRTETAAPLTVADRGILLVMVPGMGMPTGDFRANDLTAAVEQRRWPPTILAGLVPDDRVISVAGEHDWTSWGPLRRLMLDRDPFGQRAAVAS
jgi:hypothetical protein